ncbi:MAG: argininosuccinate lyase [Chloroflexi bacterium]|nr:argininosuccinate lyase [Chloroflexota bacterium]
MIKPWGGRFEKATDRLVEAFTQSVSFDRRLYRQDIAGSLAHARMLAQQGIIAPTEAEQIVAGLGQVLDEIESGEFVFREELEDIHMNIETRLRELIGEAAGRLHTARSRNDQVALDLRLWLREACDDTLAALRDLQDALVSVAGEHLTTVIPGYTHVQRAQPVLLAHHLLAYFEMFARDRERVRQARARTNVMPLGSGALAGAPYPLDRQFVAAQLGFTAITANSMDAVSDRDFALDYLSAAATCMMHLSRLCEEFVYWSSAEFGFLVIDDGYATGSSIMPQKKNPDVAELVRGKTGRVYGNLMGLLTTMKGLPLTYNRDLQEDKEAIFDTADTLMGSLHVVAGMVRTVMVDRERCREAAEGSYALATDIADYLVGRGLPFRQAHHVVGALTRYAESQGKKFSELSLEEYRRHSTLFDEAVLTISVESSVTARNVPGGVAPGQVAVALAAARRTLEGYDDAEPPR